MVTPLLRVVSARMLVHCSRLVQVAQVAPTLLPLLLGSISSANNAAKESGVRNPGYVKVTLCERS